MRAGSRRADRAVRALLAAIPFAVVCLATAVPATAQISVAEMRLLRIESTPVGALPRMPAAMPASRDHHYWSVRLQTGHRAGRGGGTDLPALGGGVDLQWRGGSVLGVTAGYQGRDCELLGPDCGSHMMFGAGGRFSIVTGSSSIGEALGDYSSTTTVGVDLGFGYAPDAAPGVPACTLDLGLPVSLAMLQTVRVVAYTTPAVVWDVDCGGGPGTGRASYLGALGFGIQQLGHRGLDVYVGVQKIFRSRSGYHFGLSVAYTHLP